MQALYKKQDGSTLICIPSTGIAGAPFLQVTLLPSHLEFADLSAEPVGWQRGKIEEHLTNLCLAWGRLPGRQEAEKLLGNMQLVEKIQSDAAASGRLMAADALISERTTAFMARIGPLLTQSVAADQDPDNKVGAGEQNGKLDLFRNRMEEFKNKAAEMFAESEQRFRDFRETLGDTPAIPSLPDGAEQLRQDLEACRAEPIESSILQSLREWVARQA